MKKLFALFAFIMMFGINQSSAQLSFGAGANIWLEGSTELGIQGRALYNINDQFDVSGAFTYYLGDPLAFALDFDAHYNLIDNESFTFAPMAGLNITRIEVLGFGSTNSAIQIGGYFTIPVNNLKLYAEPKLIIDNGSGLVVSAGILF